MRVLVVAVDPLFRRYLCRAVCALGHDAEETAGAAALLRAAAEGTPDAVLFDLDPPESGILDACAALRRARPRVRLIVVTEDPASAAAVRRFGLQDVILKPFDLAQLRGVLPSF